VYWCNF